MEYAVYAMLKASKEFAKVDPNDESDELLSDIRNSSDDWAGEENWTKSRVLPSGNFLSKEDAENYEAMLWSWDDDLESKFIPGTAEIRQEEPGRASGPASDLAELAKIEDEVKTAIRKLYDFACAKEFYHMADALDWGCGRDTDGIVDDFRILRQKLTE